MEPLPIVDLHCDMPAYLAEVDGADPCDTDDIGCALPRLAEGHVRLQVMALATWGGAASTDFAATQAEKLRILLEDHSTALFPVARARTATEAVSSGRTGVILAIENASALCEDDEPLDHAFTRLDELGQAIGPPLYVTLTHHGENRFGGGNATDVGLKDDGRTLLEHLDGRGIAVDLSHTSDALARGILHHIERRGLDLPVIASHSNLRSVWASPRNLPDELAMEIIRRKGLIGINFLRAYVHPEDPGALDDHIRHAIALGGEQALCFGADFFYTASHPDRSRVPFFFPAHEHAGRYQAILGSLAHELTPQQLDNLAWGNALRFIQRVW